MLNNHRLKYFFGLKIYSLNIIIDWVSDFCCIKIENIAESNKKNISKT